MKLEFHSGNFGTNPAIGAGMKEPIGTFNSQWGPGATPESEPSLAHKVASYVMQEFIEGIVAIRTRDLITSLLDVHSIDQLIGKKEHCDVRALIEKSLRLNRPIAARKRIIFQSGIAADLWARVNPAALSRVLDHLISNAVKYSPANSAVQVHALVENDNIVINIRDQGVGINETGRQKLFQKIARLMVDPSDAKFSNGIGMAIAKKCSAVLSGSIRWRANSECGATFTLKLPVSSETNDTLEFPDLPLASRRIMDFPGDLPGLYSQN
jgi:signal transduction histidine kinase